MLTFLLYILLVMAVVSAVGVYLKKRKSNEFVNELQDHYTKYIVKGHRLNLPEVDCGSVKLDQGEIPMFRVPAARYRSLLTGKSTLPSPQARENLGNQVFFDAGHLDISDDNEWALVDTGDLLVTDNRIIFLGVKETVTLLLDQVLRFGADSSVLRFDREQGKPLVIQARGVNTLQLFVLWTLVFHRGEMDVTPD